LNPDVRFISQLNSPITNAIRTIFYLKQRIVGVIRANWNRNTYRPH